MVIYKSVSSKEITPCILIGNREEMGRLQPVSHIQHNNVQEMIEDLKDDRTN